MKRPAPQQETWDAGYPRVSTELQVERDALQNQVQALEGYAAAHGLNLRLYPEEGVSAKDTDRPRLQELLADIRAGRIRSVVVTKLDRISRSLADLLDLMKLFEHHGVKFVSLRDNIDTSGPVGRFMLHILGAIAELERGITAERVAEDMKLRAKRGKWNGGLAPYGRRVEDGQLQTVPEEAAILHRMRALLLETRTWRGVTVALNRAGLRTRGWGSLERDGRIVRKGHGAEEWTPTSVKRVLLQPINAGTRVYNRRRAKGKTHTARPVAEHVVVPDYCEAIFTRDEMDEVLRVAAEIEGTPPRTVASPHLLSGLVECTCGTKMYGVYSYVTTKRGRYRLGYYRCRRASSKGTCASRNVPAQVVERAVIHELRQLGLDQERVAALAGDAQATFEAVVQPLVERRTQMTRELERVRSRLESLLELAEDRLVSKQEFASRKARLEAEQARLEAGLAAAGAEIEARIATVIDVEATARGLRRLGDVFDELDDVVDRRRLLRTCLKRVVLRPGQLELRVAAIPLLAVPGNGADGTGKVPGKAHSAAVGRPPKGPKNGENGAEIPRGVSGTRSERYGVRECTDARAGTSEIRSGSARAATR